MQNDLLNNFKQFMLHFKKLCVDKPQYADVTSCFWILKELKLKICGTVFYSNLLDRFSNEKRQN